MAEMKLDVQQALDKIKLLISEFTELKKAANGINKANAENFDKLAKSLDGLVANVNSAKSSLHQLSVQVNKDRLSIESHTRALRENRDELKGNTAVTKTNTSNISKHTSKVEKATKTVREFSSALKEQGSASKKASSGASEEAGAYAELVAKYKAAQTLARDLATEHGVYSKQALEAAQVTKQLQLQLDAVNNSTKENKVSLLASSYDDLKNRTNDAAARAKELATQFGENSTYAKKAADEYRALKTQLDAVNNSIKPEKVQETKSAYDQLKDKLRQAENNAKSLAISQGQNAAETKKAVAEVKKLRKELEDAEKATKKVKSSFAGVYGGIKSILGAFGIVTGIQLFANIIKEAYSLAKTFDALNFALERITDSFFKAGISQRFLMDITTSYGAELVTTTNRWIKFLAAAQQSGMTLRDTENIFRSVTKAAGVLGLKTDELTGIYLALEQMLSKGKVTTEELRRQLGERLPGAMGIMAASLGVTIPKLDEMLKKGKILSADVLPKFARALELAYGIETLESVDTLVASQERLENAWKRFVVSVSGNWQWLKDVFETISGAMTLYLKKHGTEEEKLQILTLEKYKILERHIKITGSKALEVEQAMAKKAIEINAQLADAKNKTVLKSIKLAESEEQARKDLAAAEAALKANEYQADPELARATLQKIVEIRRDYLIQWGLETDAYNKKQADNEVEGVYKKYDKLRRLREQWQKTINNYDDDLAKAETQRDKNSIRRNQKQAQDNLENSRNEFASLSAHLELITKLREKSNVVPLTDEDDDKSGRRREYWEKISTVDLRYQKAILENSLNTNEQIIDNENISWHIRLQALKDATQQALDIVEVEKQIKLKEAEETRFKIQQIDKKLEEAKKAGDTKRIQNLTDLKDSLIEIAEDTDKELLIIEEEFQQKRNDKLVEWGKRNLEEWRKWRDSIIKEAAEKKQLLIEAVDIEEALDLSKLEKDFDFNTRPIEEFEKEKFQIVKRWAIKRIEILIEELKAQAKLYDAESAHGIKIAKSIETLQNQIAIISNEMTTATTQTAKERLIRDLEGIKEVVDEIVNLTNAIYDARIQRIDDEINAEEEKYAKLIKLAEKDKEQQLHLQAAKDARLAVLEKKKRKEEHKRAVFNKAAALADIAINTAVAYTATLAAAKGFFGIPLAKIVLVLGAIQAATVLATPIPKYAGGGEIKQNEIAMINDGGKKEYIERDGTILSTDRKNAIVPLIKGDIVHKDYDTLIRKSLLLNGLSSGTELSQQNFDKLFTGIENSVGSGLKKAKIDNKIILNNILKNTNYKDSLSRWN